MNFWIGAAFFLLKFVDRVWDWADTKGQRTIQKEIDGLQLRNQKAIRDGNVEEANATRAALDEINRRLRVRNGNE